MDHPISTSAQLGVQLRSLRLAKGLSQAALGELLGIGQVRVAKIEKQPGSVSFDQLLQILHLLGARLVVQAAAPAADPYLSDKEAW